MKNLYDKNLFKFKIQVVNKIVLIAKKKPSPTGRKINESKERPNSQKSKDAGNLSDTKAKKDTKQIKRSETGSVVGGASSSASGTAVINKIL
jgi:hypothetical protein